MLENLKLIVKMWKTWSMTIKRSSETLGVKMENFCPKRRQSEILVCKIFSRPPKLGARSLPLQRREEDRDKEIKRERERKRQGYIYRETLCRVS